MQKKEAVAVVISNAEPNLDFKKAVAKEAVNEGASRVAYLFGCSFGVEDFPSSRALGQQLWVAFKDGTGRVFEFDDEISGDYSIKSGSVMRRNQLANDVLGLVRSRNSLDKKGQP